MGWEKRGKGMYYYKKIRKGNRVVSEYKGSGLFAEIISELDNDTRLGRSYSHSPREEEKDETVGINNDVDQLTEITNSLVRAVLLASGYHPHKGQWRKSRYGK